MPNEKQTKSLGERLKKLSSGYKLAIMGGLFAIAAACFGGIVAGIIPLFDNTPKTIILKIAPTDTPILLTKPFSGPTLKPSPTPTADITLTATTEPTGTATSTPVLNKITETPAAQVLPPLISMATPPAEFVLTTDNAARITQWIAPISLEDNPTSIAFSPDRKQLVVAAGNILFYDLQTMQVTKKILLDYPAYKIAFSRDGLLMATAPEFNFGQVQIWNLPAGTLKQKFTINITRDIALSPDGKMLALATANVVEIMDVETGKEIKILAPEGIIDAKSVAFSPDGKFLACGGLRIFLYDTATWQLLPQIGGDGWMDRLAFSPDGTKLAGVANGGESALVFNLPDGVHLYTLSMGNQSSGSTSSGFSGIAFSPDSQLLALSMGGSAAIKLWAMNNGHEVFRFVGHTNSVSGAAFSPNGTALATSSMDKTVLIWGLPVK